MKTLKAVTLFFAILAVGIVLAQESTETLTQQISFDNNSSDNRLVVYNVAGSINIESYNGSAIDITAEKTIKAKTNKELERGKSEIGMNVEKHGNTIFVYLKSPNTKFDPKSEKFRNEGKWGKNDYESSLDYTIKVPQGTNLKLSAINEGSILVKNVQAKAIRASHINGPITMENIAGKIQVNALNRDIDISFASNPTEDSTFDTLNGDVNLTVQKNLNADVSFKSLNGDIYTNLETTYLPSQSTSSKNSKSHGTKYKIDNNSKFRIGSGGVNLEFNLLNGDVTIKE